MNQMVVRWDWICLGIIIGVFAVGIGNSVQILLHRFLGIQQLKLEKALHCDLLRMKAKLDELDHHETHPGAC